MGEAVGEEAVGDVELVDIVICDELSGPAPGNAVLAARRRRRSSLGGAATGVAAANPATLLPGNAALAARRRRRSSIHDPRVAAAAARDAAEGRDDAAGANAESDTERFQSILAARHRRRSSLLSSVPSPTPPPAMFVRTNPLHAATERS